MSAAITRPSRLPSRAGIFLPHIRRYWPELGRRILIDSHDLRLGVFYVPGESAWLHLPGIVIQLRERGEHENPGHSSRP